MKFYQCNGCLDYFEPDQLQIIDVITESLKVISICCCEDCVHEYEKLDMVIDHENHEYDPTLT